MKHLRTKEDLRPYGLAYLTGEACAFGIRDPYDVYRNGAEILAATFGVTATEFRSTLNRPYNSGDRVDGQQPIGSCLLPREYLSTVAVIALYLAGAEQLFVVTPDQDQEGNRSVPHSRCYGECGVYGRDKEDTDDAVAAWKGQLRRTSCNVHTILVPYGLDRHARNRHTITGRTD